MAPKRKLPLDAADAIANYLKRQEPRQAARKRAKPGQPEKEVVHALKDWMRRMGWSGDVVEASTYDPRSGRKAVGKVTAGFSDIVACAPGGVACYIEVKAPKRRSTLADHQREFLVRKIKCGAFAVCVDSTELLSQLWNQWTALPRSSTIAEEYLLNALPKKRKPRTHSGDDEIDKALA